MKELNISKNGSQTANETIVESTTKYFSSISLAGKKISLLVDHNYEIPKGYHVKDLAITQFKSRNTKNYKSMYAALIKATEQGKKLNSRYLKAVQDQLAGVNCVITLPNQQELKGRIDLKGTLTQWSGDYRKVDQDLEVIDNSVMLWTNLVLLLGELSELEGKATMFAGYKSK